MSEHPLTTPVAFLVFNRPDTTQKVFDLIRQAKPPKLLVVADGPRRDRPGEAEKCHAVRAIIEQIDWHCEVVKNYSDINLGCKKRVSTGLDWVFDLVEEAIILEDDCLPHPSFFRFCEALLEKYRDDERIFTLTGQNVQMGHQRNEYTYYFSRFTQCWGWASWRRAWQHYDVNLSLWPSIRDSGLLEKSLGDAYAAKVWKHVFQSVYEQKVDTWDYQLTFASWVQNGLNIVPNVKLVENLGFGLDGTHTTVETHFYSTIPLGEVTFPLIHPPFVIRDAEADSFTQRILYNYQPNLLKRAARKIKRIPKHLSSLSSKLSRK